MLLPQANPLVLKLMQSGMLTHADGEDLTRMTAVVQNCPRDTVLVAQGEHAASTPVVLAGMAYRYRLLPDGKRQILGLLLPGDSCDIQGPLLGMSDHSTITAVDSTIAWLSRTAIDALTLANSRVARAFWWSTLVDSAILRTWLTQVGQSDATRRMAHFLCEYWLRLRIVGCVDEDWCDFPLTQSTIADALGLTNVHVNRTLRELKARDLLGLHRRRLTIPSIGALRVFCDFDPSYLHLQDDATKTPQPAAVVIG